jgi:hypothetical protein
MADLVKDSRLSTGVLGMRFMQRKAEAELAKKLGVSQDTQWSRSVSIVQKPGGATKGPTIVYEQRPDHGAARSYSRRSFGSFNSTVEATEQAELQADQTGGVAAGGGTDGAAAGRPSKRSKLAHTQLEDDDDAEEQPRFREPVVAGVAAATSASSAEGSGAWRGKLEKKRSAGTSGSSEASAGGEGAVTAGSSKKKKKKKKLSAR